MNIRFERSLWRDTYYVVAAYPTGVELCGINDAMSVRKYGSPQVKGLSPYNRACTFHPWTRDHGINPYLFPV